MKEKKEMTSRKNWKKGQVKKATLTKNTIQFAKIFKKLQPKNA